MVLVVTGVSTLIHLYSYGYMQSDEGYHRFFSYLNFFVFSMLLLVLAGNFVLLIVGWAFVGFASYALISFWYRRDDRDPGRDEGLRDQRRRRHRPRPRRLPDLPRTRDLRLRRRSSSRRRRSSPTNEWTITAICLLLLVGAFAKSAQLPFHTWLPDAMEGPTPVSSLIHAATMVTAGVYLIARTHVLFELAPTAADVAAFVGLATLLVAGDDRAGDDRPEAGDRLLDDEPDRLHDHGRLDRRLQRRHVPPDDPRLLQGAAVHGRRLDHRRDGERPEHRQDERLRQGDALHLDHASSAAPSPSPPSPAPRASSPRTRSSPTPRRAAACT